MPNNFKILIDERNANQSSFIEHLPMGAKDGLRRRSSPSIFGDQRVTHWPPWTRFLNNRLRFQTTWMVVGHVSKYGGGTTPLYRLQYSQTNMLKLIEFAAQINTRHWPLFTFLSQSQDHGQCGHVSWIIDCGIKQRDGWRPCFEIRMRRYNWLQYSQTNLV